MNHHLSVCGTSDEAINYLDEFLPQVAHTPLNLENIQQYRNRTRNDCQSSIDLAVKLYEPDFRDVQIGSVDCLSVISKKNHLRTQSKLLYFFGGGYVSGSPEEDLPITSAFAHHLGVEVICPRYRLAPEYPYPCAIEDGQRVYSELANSKDCKQMLIAGESAGGNLALQTLLWAHSMDMALPKSCALLSPWIDLGSEGDSLIFNDGRDPSLMTEDLKNYADLFRGKLTVSDSQLSPLFADFGNWMPPTMVTSGTRDLLLSHCIQLSTKLQSAGANISLRVWENMWHVFEFYPQLPEAAQSLDEISAFLSRHIK